MAEQPEVSKELRLGGRSRGANAAGDNRRSKAPRASEAVPYEEATTLKDPFVTSSVSGPNTTPTTTTNPPPPVAPSPVVAEDIFAIAYDTYSAADLHALLQQVTRSEVERRMAEFDQQRRKTNHAPRVERFLDVTGSSSSNNNNSNSTGSEVCTGYTYNDMLQRIFIALNRNKESSGMSERNQLPVPQVEKISKKKVVIVNFRRICEVFSRPIEDVKDYIEKELSVGGNLDSNDSLILKYEIQKVTDFDKILIKYLDEYVKCNSCHKIDTTLTKEGRRMELRCNWCTATRSVQAVGSATYSAQVGKRSRARRQAMTL
ncbi:eukaryotic translation initiation factor 2 beta subunit [Trypanosoma brucei equiperdum]|uniref:Eukaryotic translation initiation factor 2 beta subunit n=1 Tax=Trypanosoma brucei equiperdum TaxID=630700 RepID=A0A3L6L7B7_9TRYP|nr:eukaryotic translation initiation factor 2 beta subunit [Trypanosoma brucei equiperdum]